MTQAEIVKRLREEYDIRNGKQEKPTKQDDLLTLTKPLPLPPPPLSAGNLRTIFSMVSRYLSTCRSIVSSSESLQSDLVDLRVGKRGLTWVNRGLGHHQSPAAAAAAVVIVVVIGFLLLLQLLFRFFCVLVMRQHLSVHLERIHTHLQTQTSRRMAGLWTYLDRFSAAILIFANCLFILAVSLFPRSRLQLKLNFCVFAREV